MSTAKKNILITLDTIEIPSLKHSRVNKHLLDMTLVWPRLGVSSKNYTLTIPLACGTCDATEWSWSNKVCFKESVEGTFGFKVALTETMTAANIRNFMRFLAGKSAKIAADAVEDAISVPVVDDLAALPALYLSKQLLASEDPRLIVEGCIDLQSADFSDTPVTITVPLLSRRSIPKKITKNAPDGFAVFTAVTF